MSLIRALMPFTGILMMICASLGKSTVQALAKLVSVRELYNIPIFEVLFFITSFRLIPGFVALAYMYKHFGVWNEADAEPSSQVYDSACLPRQFRRDNHIPQKFNFKEWIPPVVGPLSGACVIVFQFAALRSMSLGNASVVFWTFPAILYVLSIILGREHITTVKTMSLLLILVGCMLVIKPEVLFHDKEAESSDHETVSRYLFQHAGYALIAAFLQAVSFISKRAEQKIGPRGFIIRGIVGSAACVAWMWAENDPVVPPFTILDGAEEYERVSAAALPWIAIICAAILYSASEYAQEKACVNEAVSTVGCVGALEVIFAFVWQVIMFGDVPDWVSITGAGCIFISVLILILRKEIAVINATASRRPSGADNGVIEEEEETDDEEDGLKVTGVVSEDNDERRRLL